MHSFGYEITPPALTTVRAPMAKTPRRSDGTVCLSEWHLVWLVWPLFGRSRPPADSAAAEMRCQRRSDSCFGARQTMGIYTIPQAESSAALQRPRSTRSLRSSTTAASPWTRQDAGSTGRGISKPLARRAGCCERGSSVREPILWRDVTWSGLRSTTNRCAFQHALESVQR